MSRPAVLRVSGGSLDTPSGLTALDDKALATVVPPLGLISSRVSYPRSLAGFVSHADAAGTDLAPRATREGPAQPEPQ